MNASALFGLLGVGAMVGGAAADSGAVIIGGFLMVLLVVWTEMVVFGRGARR